MQLEPASETETDLNKLANAGIKPIDGPRCVLSGPDQILWALVVEWLLLIWQVAMPHFEKSSDRNWKHRVELRAKSMSAQMKAW